MPSAPIFAQYATELGGENGGQRCRAAQEGKKLLMSVYVVPGGEPGRRCACTFGQMLGEGREQGGRLPRQRLEGLLVEVLAPQSDEIGPFIVGRRTQDGCPRGQLFGYGCPVYFVEGRAVASHHNDLLVSLFERIGDSIREARTESLTPLMSVSGLQDRKAAGHHGTPRVLVERRCDFPVLREVLPHEPFVLPLVLGAVAEEQEGGMSGRRLDGARWGRQRILRRNNTS